MNAKPMLKWLPAFCAASLCMTMFVFWVFGVVLWDLDFIDTLLLVSASLCAIQVVVSIIAGISQRRIQIPLIGIFCSCFLLVLSVVLALLPHRIDRIKKDSALDVNVNWNGSKDYEVMMRNVVLQELPMGSDRPHIEAFLSRNFSGVPYTVRHKSPRAALYEIKEPCIFIRAQDYREIPCRWTLEFYLILDNSEHLKDVVVRHVNFCL